MAEQFIDDIEPQLTLSTAITSTTATTITPSSVTALPSTGTFRIIIDSEIMKASVSGSNLTVVRGDGGTTAATHNVGATIIPILTKEALDAICTILSGGTEIANRRALNFIGATVADNSANSRVDITVAPSIGIGAAASLPTSPSTGQLYIPTDGTIADIYDGAEWAGLDLTPYTLPPTLTNWTQLNMTGSTVSDVPGGGITIVPKVTSSGNVAGIVRSLPSHGTAWTRTANFHFAGTGRCGILLYDSTTQKCQGYCWLTGVPGLDEIYYTNPTTATSNVGQWNIATIGPSIRLRVQDNGSTRYFQFSSDGINWITITSESNTNNVTPDHAGFFLDPQNSSIPAMGTLLHWVESSP